MTIANATATTTASPIYWGAYIDGNDTYGGSYSDAPWDSSTWDLFERHAGKKVSLLHYGQPPPWERAFDYGPWDVFTFLMEYRYKFLFACPEGLVAYAPTRARPFPSQYTSGYNVVAFNATHHRDRVRNLERLLLGVGTRILAMPPPPCPNSMAYPLSRTSVHAFINALA